ncbi:inactive histone-lysine N-methyltransferase 2E-like [Tigriopus californicus]|uniref:inactive histone-lysine N-methyltransferase 2E-like n=1 Tax=Tigriopus californicus TaxID=6832 RepID=UPI0027DA9EDB|nr:inactive histone-lysine N-methyltransferase 2E-like [Tigriopus californicus]
MTKAKSLKSVLLFFICLSTCHQWVRGEAEAVAAAEAEAIALADPEAEANAKADAEPAPKAKPVSIVPAAYKKTPLGFPAVLEITKQKKNKHSIYMEMMKDPVVPKTKRNDEPLPWKAYEEVITRESREMMTRDSRAQSKPQVKRQNDKFLKDVPKEYRTMTRESRSQIHPPPNTDESKANSLHAPKPIQHHMNPGRTNDPRKRQTTQGAIGPDDMDQGGSSMNLSFKKIQSESSGGTIPMRDFFSGFQPVQGPVDSSQGQGRSLSEGQGGKTKKLSSAVTLDGYMSGESQNGAMVGFMASQSKSKDSKFMDKQGELSPKPKRQSNDVIYSGTFTIGPEPEPQPPIVPGHFTRGSSASKEVSSVEDTSKDLPPFGPPYHDSGIIKEKANDNSGDNKPNEITSNMLPPTSFQQIAEKKQKKADSKHKEGSVGFQKIEMNGVEVAFDIPNKNDKVRKNMVKIIRKKPRDRGGDDFNPNRARNPNKARKPVRVIKKGEKTQENNDSIETDLENEENESLKELKRPERGHLSHLTHFPVIKKGEKTQENNDSIEVNLENEENESLKELKRPERGHLSHLTHFPVRDRIPVQHGFLNDLDGPPIKIDIHVDPHAPTPGPLQVNIPIDPQRQHHPHRPELSHFPPIEPIHDLPFPPIPVHEGDTHYGAPLPDGQAVSLDAPSDHYGPPTKPLHIYGAPLPGDGYGYPVPEENYGPPEAASVENYGPPPQHPPLHEPADHYGPPQHPQIHEPEDNYGPLEHIPIDEPSNHYGPTPSPTPHPIISHSSTPPTSVPIFYDHTTPGPNLIQTTTKSHSPVFHNDHAHDLAHAITKTPNSYLLTTNPPEEVSTLPPLPAKPLHYFHATTTLAPRHYDLPFVPHSENGSDLVKGLPKLPHKPYFPPPAPSPRPFHHSSDPHHHPRPTPFPFEHEKHHVPHFHESKGPLPKPKEPKGILSPFDLVHEIYSKNEHLHQVQALPPPGHLDLVKFGKGQHHDHQHHQEPPRHHPILDPKAHRDSFTTPLKPTPAVPIFHSTTAKPFQPHRPPTPTPTVFSHSSPKPHSHKELTAVFATASPNKEEVRGLPKKTHPTPRYHTNHGPSYGPTHGPIFGPTHGPTYRPHHGPTFGPQLPPHLRQGPTYGPFQHHALNHGPSPHPLHRSTVAPHIYRPTSPPPPKPKVLTQEILNRKPIILKPNLPLELRGPTARPKSLARRPISSVLTPRPLKLIRVPLSIEEPKTEEYEYYYYDEEP